MRLMAWSLFATVCIAPLVGCSTCHTPYDYTGPTAWGACWQGPCDVDRAGSILSGHDGSFAGDGFYDDGFYDDGFYDDGFYGDGFYGDGYGPSFDYPSGSGTNESMPSQGSDDDYLREPGLEEFQLEDRTTRAMQLRR